MSITLTPNIIHQEILLGYNTMPNDMATSIIKSIIVIKNNYNKKKINIALLTPYIYEIHQITLDFLLLQDCNIIIDKNLNLENDSLTSSLSLQTIKDIIENMYNTVKEDINIFIIGCSAFKVTQYGFIDELEKIYTKTIFITSNQTLIWYSLYLG